MFNQRHFFPLIVLLFFIGSAGHILAQQRQKQPSDVQAFLARPFRVYSEQGTDAFIRVFLAGSVMRISDSLTQQDIYNLKTADSLFGKFNDFEINRIVKPSSRTRFVYLVMNYEKGALFMYLTLYKGPNGWQVQNYKFYSEAERDWPDSLRIGLGSRLIEH